MIFHTYSEVHPNNSTDANDLIALVTELNFSGISFAVLIVIYDLLCSLHGRSTIEAILEELV